MGELGGGLTATASRLRASISDEKLIFAAIFISALPYVSAIGFYSDDWALLQSYDSLRSHGLGQLLREGFETPSIERPLYGIYLSALFALFGLNPLPHHLINTGVLALSGVVLFKLLKDLKVPRDLAFATAILFGFLPQLTTLRVWYATFQIGLSLLLFLSSVRLELRFARQGGARAKILALACAAGSLAAYETTAPLLVASALGAARIRARRSGRWVPALAATLPNLLLIAGGLGLKRLVTNRIHDPSSLADQLGVIWETFWSPSYDWKTSDGLNLWAALSVNFWHSFVAEAHSLIRVWDIPHSFAVVFLSAVFALVAFAKLNTSATPASRWSCAPAFVLAGFAVFWLGYAIFFLNRMVHFAPVSTGNRMATPASIGVAMVLVGAAKLFADTLGGPYRRQLFGAIVGVAIGVGCIHANLVASRWASAWSTEATVLDRATIDLAALPDNATIILDGVCPYDGPAIVFEAPWDWSSAVSIKLGKTVNGDVAIPSLQVTDAGMTTQIYDIKNTYAYGSGLYVYRPDARRVIAIPTLQAAQTYWPHHQSAARKCPRGYPTMGVLNW